MFLQSTKNLPLLYINVIYSKSIIMNILLNITLYFEITSEIISEEQLLNNTIYGNYYIELNIFVPDNPIKKKILLNDIQQNSNTPNNVPLKDNQNFNFNRFPGNDEIITILKEITKSEHIISYMKNIILKNEEIRIKRFGGNYDCKIPIATVKL